MAAPPGHRLQDPGLCALGRSLGQGAAVQGAGPVNHIDPIPRPVAQYAHAVRRFLFGEEAETTVDPVCKKEFHVFTGG